MLPPPAELVPEPMRSGRAFQSEDSRALQDDPVANPGLLWVARGEELWAEPPPRGPSCAGCHGEATASMRGVAARYPAIDAGSGRLLNLEGRLNRCRRVHQGLPPLPYEGEELLSLTAFVAYQSRGMPIRVRVDGAAEPWFRRGHAFYASRQGQLNLACRHCHQDSWGKRLRGETLSQGHGNGFPLYRLEWQSLGSLHRRFKVCSAGVRAQLYDYGSPEYLALELFLAWRASGLPVESPAIRR